MIVLSAVEQKIAKILVEGAKARKKVVFTEIMQRVGIGRRNLGKYLDHIGHKCLEQGLPIITSLAVYKGTLNIGKGYATFDKTFPYDKTLSKIEQQKAWDNQSWEKLIA